MDQSACHGFVRTCRSGHRSLARCPTITDGSPTDTVQISIPKTEAGGSDKLFGRLQVVKP